MFILPPDDLQHVPSVQAELAAGDLHLLAGLDLPVGDGASHVSSILDLTLRLESEALAFPHFHSSLGLATASTGSHS